MDIEAEYEMQSDVKDDLEVSADVKFEDYNTDAVSSDSEYCPGSENEGFMLARIEKEIVDYRGPFESRRCDFESIGLPRVDGDSRDILSLQTSRCGAVVGSPHALTTKCCSILKRLSIDH